MAIAAVFFAAAVCAKPKAKETSLLAHGLSLAALMREKATSSDYVSLMVGANEDLGAKVREFAAGDVSEPNAVYRVSGDFFSLGELMQAVFGSNVSLSPVLKRDMANRLRSGFALMWTGMRGGSLELAAASLLQSQTVFVSAELAENCLYIYTFADGFPVAVSFMKGDGGAVLASASYVLDEDFPASLSAMLDEIAAESGREVLRLEKVKWIEV